MAGVGLNKVLMIGNLTKDPELRYLPNGTPKAELRIATSRTYTTNGEKREDTCSVDVVAWSRTAENANQYLKKGSKIFVEGRLDYQEWEGQDGSKRSKHVIVADRVQFMDSRPGAGGEGGEMGGEMGEGGGRSYSAGSSYRNNAGNAGNAGRGSYAPRGNTAPQGGAPAGSPPSGAPVQESGRPAAGGLNEAMGVNDDDIPF